MPRTAPRPVPGHHWLMRVIGLLAMLCVLSIFLFPAHQGPYSVIHGPVTAMRAMLLALRLFSVLALLVLNPWFAKLLYFSIYGPRSKNVFSRNSLPLRATQVLPPVFRC